MGDYNQLFFAQHFLKDQFQSILEIGSKDYGSTVDFRNYFKKCKNYIGVDMEDGKDVDVVMDLTKTTEPLEPNFFDLIICCSVLEHVDAPWLFANNINKLSSKGGLLYIAVPFVWRFHGYPNDYFRYTHNGIKKLFNGYSWDRSFASTYQQGKFIEIKNNFQEICDKLSRTQYDEKNKPIEKYISYIQVLMIGKKL